MAWSLLALPLASLLSPWRYFVELGVHRRTPRTQTLVMAVISVLALFLFALPYLDRIARRARGQRPIVPGSTAPSDAARTASLRAGGHE